MKICGKCGTQVNEEVKFCPNCGGAVETLTKEQTTQTEQSTEGTSNAFVDKVKGLNDTKDETADYDAKDISENRGISVLSYFGPLVFIPMFVKKESKFARFHANQGLVLFIADVAYGIVQNILLAILRSIFPWNWNYGYLGGRGFVYDALSIVLSLVWLVIGILAVIGLINALNGKAKELPVIGKFKILK